MNPTNYKNFHLNNFVATSFNNNVNSIKYYPSLQVIFMNWKSHWQIYYYRYIIYYHVIFDCEYELPSFGFMVMSLLINRLYDWK